MPSTNDTVSTKNPMPEWLEELARVDGFAGWVFDELRPYVRGKVLEVGCGRGTYTRALAKAASSVISMDLDDATVETARRATLDLPNVTVLEGDATVETPGDEFDTIVLLDVLEHIEHDRAFLRKLASKLSPDGRLIVKVPAYRWLYGAVDSAVGHHRRYTRTSLGETLADGGFRARDLWYFNAAAIPGWWLNSVVLRRETPSSAQLSLFSRVLPLAKTLDRVLRPIAGLSVFAVAEKGSS